MAKLLYQDDDEDPKIVSKLAWECIIKEARQEVADELKDTEATIDVVLDRMQAKMEGVHELLRNYKDKFGEPYPEKTD